MSIFQRVILVALAIAGLGSSLAADAKTDQSGSINAPQVSVQGLAFESPPSESDLIAAGQLGGPLYPTDELKNKRQADQVNQSFGQAIEAWNRHEYPHSIKLFEKHLKDYPDSPWAAEAELHMACEAQYQGRYSEAEKHHQSILDKNATKTSFGAQKLYNKATLRLGTLKVLQNNFDDAKTYFTKLKAEGVDWRERTYASHWLQRLSRYQSQEQQLMRCGFEALAHMLEQAGKTAQAQEVLQLQPSSKAGQSIKELVTLSAKYGYQLQGRRVSSAELSLIPLPSILHIQGNGQGDRGHYWILEKLANGQAHLYDPQARRRFQQTLDELSQQWQGVILVFESGQSSLPGTALSEAELAELTGGCCGKPTPQDGLGASNPARYVDGPTDSMDPNTPSQPTCSNGEPNWEINKINMNLFVQDTPCWYKPAIGPAIELTLSYNSQSSDSFNQPFGNKWQFKYSSYLVVDPGGEVTIEMPDGRLDMYTPDGNGGYQAPVNIHNTLTKIAENHFELTFNTGWVFVYAIPTGTSSQQPFLTEVRDVYGQRLQINYDANVRLASITDATNKLTTFTYDNQNRVIQATDPFGRSAKFEYDTNSNLTKITDMGGYWTKFTYDEDVYLTSLENPSGTWQFYIEPADGIRTNLNDDNYPPPGEAMWANYRITITSPQAEREEYFYYGGCDETTCDGQTWYVSPRDYIPWQDQATNNFRSRTPKTRYVFTEFGVGGRGQISKRVLPDGSYTNYTYDTQGRRTAITDSQGNTQTYTYNDDGSVASSTEPNGHTTYFSYKFNGTVPEKIWDNRGEIVFTSNDKREITRITDRLGHQTNLSYNSFGQLATVTDAEGVVSEYLYDADHRLVTVKRDSQVVASFTYDAIGRITSSTDAIGIVKTFDYDGLNQLKEVAYPDGKKDTNQLSADRPFVTDSTTDRGGRTTRYVHNPFKEVTASINAEAGRTVFNYDANGNLLDFLDPNSNKTRYEYDTNNRLTKKIYADNTKVTLTYDALGRTATRTNARGITATYSYDVNSNLTGISYSDTTPAVSYTYDEYNRVTQRQDAVGIYKFTYDNNDRLTSVDGPWENDTISYTYDALGRRIGMTPQGGEAVNWGYDRQGRLKTVTVGGDSYQYAYDGVNPLVKTLTRPNGSITRYQYDNLARLTQLSNEKSDGTIINRFDYTYNAQDLRGTETITNGDPITNFEEGLISYQTNNLNQLTSSTNPARTYEYDADGNMTKGYTPAGYVFTATYDAADRLSTLTFTDSSNVVHKTVYVYQGNGFVGRIKKYLNNSLTDDIRFVKDGSLLIQERNEINNINCEYIWKTHSLGGIGTLLSLKQSGQKYEYLYDGKGNVLAILDSSNSLSATYRYDSYGSLKIEAGNLKQPILFSTKYFDLESGLYDFGYRHYTPIMGRWINRDPIGLNGGMNLYAFSMNNPINKIDPLGLCGFNLFDAINNIFKPIIPDNFPFFWPFGDRGNGGGSGGGGSGGGGSGGGGSGGGGGGEGVQPENPFGKVNFGDSINKALYGHVVALEILVNGVESRQFTRQELIAAQGALTGLKTTVEVTKQGATVAAIIGITAATGGVAGGVAGSVAYRGAYTLVPVSVF